LRDFTLNYFCTLEEPAGILYPLTSRVNEQTPTITGPKEHSHRTDMLLSIKISKRTNGKHNYNKKDRESTTYVTDDHGPLSREENIPE